MNEEVAADRNEGNINDKKKNNDVTNDLLELNEAVLESIETINNMNIMVEDAENCDSVLIQKEIKAFVGNLQKMYSCSNDLDIEIPTIVLEKIDSNSNPETYIDELYARVKEQNDLSRGRVFSTHVLKESLKQKIQHWKEVKEKKE